MTVQEFCKDDKSMSGLNYYELPVLENPVKIKDFKVSTGKKVGCYDDQKCMGYMPTPGPIYVPHEDWMKTELLSPNRGKFGKYKKITLTEEVMKKEQYRMSPC